MTRIDTIRDRAIKITGEGRWPEKLSKQMEANFFSVQVPIPIPVQGLI